MYKWGYIGLSIFNQGIHPAFDSMLNVLIRDEGESNSCIVDPKPHIKSLKVRYT